jgi:dTDP-4-amino-4,6-dideoxygalactose transaminase
MLVSRDAERIGNARALRSRNAVASPLSDLQAALGLSQLARYQNFLARRKELADYYLRHLPPAWTKGVRAVEKNTMFFRFPTTPEDGSFPEWQRRFELHGIAVRRGVDKLLHAFAGASSGYPGAERCFAETVSLPLYPALGLEEAERIVETVHKLRERS